MLKSDKIKLARSSGVLLPIFSLPSDFGIGDFGPGAYQFVDFLVESKQRFWQILPLNPTEGIFGHSPYSSISAFAGNILFISPRILVQDGFLKEGDINNPPAFGNDVVDYQGALAYKKSVLDLAYERFKKKESKDSGQRAMEFEGFCAKENYWLRDFALFAVLKKLYLGMIFTQWPKAVKERDPIALRHIEDKFQVYIEQEKFFQFLFFQQWAALKKYAHSKNIEFIGDIPIYVNDDSVDVWTHPEFFKLNSSCEPEYVAGVPPDYFSKTGQRWGNPVYNWENLRHMGFQWWIDRIGHNLELFDWIRIDHFRGFVAYWEIPASEKTAIQGRWVHAPCDELFTALQSHFGKLPIIAEDLGIITSDVTAAKERYGFPGMKILLFAFDGDLKTHPYIPENYEDNCVVYTGTHDNNTAKGWFLEEAGSKTKENLFRYLGRDLKDEDVSWALVELAFKSPAKTTIIPFQDLLGWGEQARTNIPGTIHGNWRWRMKISFLDLSFIQKMANLTKASRRN